MQKMREIKPTAEAFGGRQMLKLYGNKHLTTKNQKLLLYAKKLKEEYNVWPFKEKVMCRRKIDGSSPTQLLDTEDIDYSASNMGQKGVLTEKAASEARSSAVNF